MAKTVTKNFKISTELLNIKRNYDKSIMIVSGFSFRQKDVIKMIEFYSNSKYLNGQKDELKREKPFYQILNGICDVENAAKDIDTKDIHATSDDGNHYTESFLMTKDIYEWMKGVNFGKTLNDMRDMHTKYGSLLVKKCYEKDENGKMQLYIDMPEWKNVITDQVDILNNPIVEVHYMTASDLLDQTEWDQAAIQKLLQDLVREGYQKRVPVYEVRGNFPRSFYNEVMDEKNKRGAKTDFSYQLYYLAGEPVDPNMATGRNDDNFYLMGNLTPLYCEDDTEQVYKYLARKKRAGRAFGVGVFEEGEQAQIWTNDAVLKQTRASAITTKAIGQSASKKLKGRNLLTEVDDGQILEHEPNAPITALQLGPSGGMAQFQTLMAQWFGQLEKATSAYATQRGEVTTKNFRLQQLALQQSSLVFQDLQEELGIFITEIFNDWVLPHLTKQLNAAHILAHDFTLQELQEIDKNFSTYQANQMAIEQMLSGKIVTAQDYALFMQQANDLVNRTKTKRFLEIPKDYYKKLKAKITINVTGEQQNKALVLESLMNIMKIYASNPAIISDPVMTQLFMRIVELSGSGISPVSLVGAIQERAKMMADQAGSDGKVSESMNFKDLPPEGQYQMAAKAGIKLNPNQTMPAPEKTVQVQKGKSVQPTRFSLTASGQ